MDHLEAGKYWEANAPAWTTLVRQGYDVYRDFVNTPAFLDLLPDIAGRTGLDAGCGEGHNTRLFAARGARMFGIDIAPAFVRAAAAVDPGAIPYAVGSAQQLPFAAARFDFATSLMCLMDLPDPAAALRELHRVLRPGGFLQFSITHPCFSPPHRRLLRTPAGEPYAVELGRYFERVPGRVERWLFSSAPAEAKAGLRPFEIPLFHYTLAEWLHFVRQAGFLLEEVREPHASEATAREVPQVADTRVVAYFLHVLCRKA